MFELIFAAIQKHFEMKIADFLYGVKDGMRALEEAAEEKREAAENKPKVMGFGSAGRTTAERAENKL